MTGLDVVEALSRPHASYRRRTLGSNAQGAARVYVPEGREGHEAREDHGYATARNMEEHDDGTRTQLRLDEIGEDSQTLKAKVIS